MECHRNQTYWREKACLSGKHQRNCLNYSVNDLVSIQQLHTKDNNSCLQICQQSHVPHIIRLPQATLPPKYLIPCHQLHHIKSNPIATHHEPANTFKTIANTLPNLFVVGRSQSITWYTWYVSIPARAKLRIPNKISPTSNKSIQITHPLFRL